MPATQPSLLDRAVTGRMSGTLWIPQEPGRQWSVRFLAYEPVHNGLWVEPLGADQSSLDSAIASGAQVEIALCQNHTRHAFRTTIVRRNKHFWLTETMMFNGLLLRGPIKLQPAERRACMRYQVPDGSHIASTIIYPGAFTPTRVTPWDICPAGVSFLCPREAAVTALKADDAVTLKIASREKLIAAKGVVRFSRFLTDRVIKVGMKFVPASLDEQSQQHLVSFISDLQKLARPNSVRVGR